MKNIVILILIFLVVIGILFWLPDCQRYPTKVVQVVYGSDRDGNTVTTYVLENGRQNSTYGIVNVGDIKNVCD